MTNFIIELSLKKKKAEREREILFSNSLYTTVRIGGEIKRRFEIKVNSSRI